MNKVTLIGNFTKDPELNETKDGIPACRFSLAVKRIGAEQADFFNIVAWRGLAENVVKYCRKGSKVAVIGELKVENYEDRYGNYKTAVKINAQEIEFLSTNPQNNIDSNFYNSASYQKTNVKKVTLQPIDDDDIPF